ncbi:MAG: DUF938 domain-containing protein [Legionellaceae bacterium]|nr:DUF938 domain-containing protein [Legionellaceae bacterium]
MNTKPFSQAADNNKQSIADVLQQHIQSKQLVLETGSGTGQHISYFAELFPNVIWQPSDMAQNIFLPRIDFSEHSNILKPFALDVKDKKNWPTKKYDVVYTANTTHIMSWSEVLLMIEMIGITLNPSGLFFCYGPFRFNGKLLAISNQEFDKSLRDKSSQMGVRDASEIESAALEEGLELLKMYDMPKNNTILVFQKRA